MGTFIQDLVLNKDLFQGFTTNSQVEQEYTIRNLSKINLFVGSNNSGKSQLIRKIFSLEKSKLSFIPTMLDVTIIDSIIEKFPSEIRLILSNNSVTEYEDLSRRASELKRLHFFTAYTHNIDPLKNFLKYASEITENGQFRSNTRFSGRGPGYSISQHVRLIANQYIEAIEKLNYDDREAYEFTRVYIPTLRGLRPFIEGGDVYFDRTNKDYFESSTLGEYCIVFTGLGMYEEVTKLLLGNLEKREIIASFQKFLGDYFFDGQEVVLIPSYDHDVLNVKIGKETERPIYDLGDGCYSRC